MEVVAKVQYNIRIIYGSIESNGQCVRIVLTGSVFRRQGFSTNTAPYLELDDFERQGATELHGEVSRPSRPLVATAPCARVTLSELPFANRSLPLVVVGAQPTLAAGIWADPLESPLARFGQEQTIRAVFSPDYNNKVAGTRHGTGPVLRLPAVQWITFARLIHLATRRAGASDVGCCLKAQNIPFLDGDAMLPDILLKLVSGGRDPDVLKEGEDFYLPQIWANQAGAVTHAHYDEADAVILQAAGTRTATLYSPSQRDRLLVERDLPVETLVIAEVNTAVPPNATRFPGAYRLVACADHPDACTLEDADGSTRRVEVVDKDTAFSPLDLASHDAPRPDFTCAIDPGDALYVPRHWFHRIDDDPHDANTDIFQVSFNYWFHLE